MNEQTKAWPDIPEATFRPTAEGQELPLARVAAYLAGAGFAVDPAYGARRLAGGLANLNFLICVDGAPVVLRRPPGGELPKGAYDMGREQTILSRLWRVLDFAPRGLHLCTDKAVIGADFQLIEFRQGIIIRGAEMPFPGRGGALSEILAETLARLHAVDPASVGLDRLGRPEGFVTRAIEGWCGRGAAAAGTDDDRHLVAETGDWLRRQKLATRPPTLLHNDFKLDNCILAPETLRPVAVIDWDQGTRGDPLFDLATLLSYWTEPGDPPCLHALQQMPTAAPGFLSRDAMVALYARLTGRDVADYPVLRVLAVFKVAVIFLQLHQRWVQGALGDDRYARFRTVGADLLAYAHDITRNRAE